MGVTFNYYYGLQADKYSFYRIPKLLFTHTYFSILSCEAKVLYGILLDRMSLSAEKGWFDEENRVFIIFTIEEITRLMSCAKQKAIKLMAELDTDKGIGLIEKKRKGQGKANVIYVKNFMLPDSRNIKPQMPCDSVKIRYDNQNGSGMKNELPEVLKTDFYKNEKRTSRSMKPEPQEVPKSAPSNTDLSNTDGNDTYPNPIQAAEDGIKGALDAYREIIHDNIDYDVLVTQHSKEDVDGIVNLILEVVSSNRRIIRISGEDISAGVVKSRLMKLNLFHLQYVMECLDKNTTKVKNIKKYLLAVLYNAPITMHHYYKAEVQHGLYGD